MSGKRIVSGLLHRLSPGYRQHVADVIATQFEGITYRRLSAMGFRPGAIVDVGACAGNWTRMTQAQFGKTPAVMVEAREEMRRDLEAVRRDHPQVDFEITMLSAASGESHTFYEMDTGSSFLPENSNVPRKATVLVSRTLDDVIAAKLPKTDTLFIKIDVQGAELHVLRGGLESLKRAALVQLEVALLAYNEGAPLMPEVIAFMADRGLFPTEIAGFSRPNGHLVQVDMLFAPQNSPLRPTQFTF